MTSQEIKALQDSNLATNDSHEITAAKLREVTTELIKNDGGVLYYVNSNNGYIQGCMDEWVDGMQLSDRLRQALAFEEDPHYETF